MPANSIQIQGKDVPAAMMEPLIHSVSTERGLGVKKMEAIEYYRDFGINQTYTHLVLAGTEKQ